MYKGKFTFHSVGQGLFYSGNIFDTRNGDKSIFSFVYDCGSQTRGKGKFVTNGLVNEIDAFKFCQSLMQDIRYDKMRIDLLVLSHLDADHYNGLDKLLKNIDVGTIIIPYFKHLTKHTLKSLSLVSESRFERIFVLVAQGDVQDFRSEDFSNIRGRIADDRERREETVRAEFRIRHGNEAIGIDSEFVKGILTYKKGSASFDICSPYDNKDRLWEFITFNKPIGDASKRAYQTSIAEFEKKVCDLEKAVRDADKIKLLKNFVDSSAKQIIKKYVKNENSVVLYHRPLFDSARFYSYYQEQISSCNHSTRCCCCDEIVMNCHRGKKYLDCNCCCEICHNRFYRDFDLQTATLLTGDFDSPSQADLYDLKEVLDGDYYEWKNRREKLGHKNDESEPPQRARKIGVFQVPHHGSRMTWADEFYRRKIAIISAGFDNSYGHPHIETTNKLKAAHSMIIRVNENNATRFLYEIRN